MFQFSQLHESPSTDRAPDSISGIGSHWPRRAEGFEQKFKQDVPWDTVSFLNQVVFSNIQLYDLLIDIIFCSRSHWPPIIVGQRARGTVREDYC